MIALTGIFAKPIYFLSIFGILLPSIHQVNAEDSVEQAEKYLDSIHKIFVKTEDAKIQTIFLMIKDILMTFKESATKAQKFDIQNYAEFDRKKLEDILGDVNELMAKKVVTKMEPKVVFGKTKKIRTFLLECLAYGLKVGSKIDEFKIDDDALNEFGHKLDLIMLPAKEASLICQDPVEYNKMHMKMQWDNKVEWEKLLDKLFGHKQALLQPVEKIIRDERKLLAKNNELQSYNVQTLKQIKADLPIEYRDYLALDPNNNFDMNKMMKLELSEEVWKGIGNKLETVKNGLQKRNLAMTNWNRVAKKTLTGTGRSPVLLSSNLNLAELERNAKAVAAEEEEAAKKDNKEKPTAGKGEEEKGGQNRGKAMGKGKDEEGKKKETEENDEEKAVSQIPLEQLKSHKKALEELMKILKIFDASIGTVYQKMEELEESHRNAKKEEPKKNEGEKEEEGNKKKENVEMLSIDNEFRRIAYEFRHMEYYLWMNRANRELFENLEKLIKISTASEDGFSQFIELKEGAKEGDGDGLLWKKRADMEEAMLASRELAKILWQFVERLNLADVVKETIKVEMASPKAANESEERKGQTKWHHVATKGTAKETDANNEEEGQNAEGLQQKVEASSKEAGENEIKKKAMASGDSKLLHYANAELRKWKTEIRWETVKMLLAYQKMDKSIQFEKFVDENASSKLVAEKKHNGLIQSLEDVPMPKDVTELVQLLVEKMSEYKHHQQVRQHV